MTAPMLGDTCRDVVSGFQGRAIARIENLYAVPQILIAARHLHEGRRLKSEWFDEPQVERVLIPDEPTVAGPASGDQDATASAA